MSAPYHAEELTAPEPVLVITLLQNMVVLTVLAVQRKLGGATKLRAHVSRDILRSFSPRIQFSPLFKYALSNVFNIVPCKDDLPTKMTSDKNCKKLRKPCPKLKSHCTKTLGSALGSSAKAKKCRTALKRAKNSKVRNYCQKTCNYQCGKIAISFVNSI